MRNIREDLKETRGNKKEDKQGKEEL